ncbi:3968_t:CDS:10 [Ambispora gerdemannii]|uniref:3968_t:CDS:1 n=1 Tax=Ambispora gerdemannii TaxID=144530 RepID=A0A9N9AT19_9GLOM|nr:3968_t:CDS:10 [Ambispora gerdemannii]
MSKHIAKSAVRSVKNFSKGYSDIQVKVRAATSNEPWGPSGTAMNEIAQATYNHHEFIEIMEMIDKRLNDHGKNWRHVFKALTLLDYCLHVGAENVVLYAKDNFYIVKTLREFQFIDEDGKDQGSNVRQKAKDITNLLQDDERLKAERRSRSTMHNRISGRDEPGSSYNRDISLSYEQQQQPGYFNDDDELQRAIEESKKLENERRLKESINDEDSDLEKAIQLSKEEEEKRKQAEEVARKEVPLIQGDTSSFTPVTSQQLQQSPEDFFSPLTQFSTNPYQQQLLQLQLQPQNSYQQQLSLQQQAQQAINSTTNNPTNAATFGNDPLGLNFQQSSYSTPSFNAQNSSTLTPFDSSFGIGQQSNNGLNQLKNDQLLKQQQANSLLRSQTLKATTQDNKYSKLNNLLAARGDGLDTFGNQGDLRVPAGTGFSSLQPARSNSASSIGTPGANPFFKNEGSSNNVGGNLSAPSPYLSGTFSNSQPNLSLSNQNNNNSDLYSTFSASSFATTNTLIDLSPATNNTNASKNPFQIQQQPQISTNLKPKSLGELQFEQLGYNNSNNNSLF